MACKILCEHQGRRGGRESIESDESYFLKRGILCPVGSMAFSLAFSKNIGSVGLNTWCSFSFLAFQRIAEVRIGILATWGWIDFSVCRC